MKRQKKKKKTPALKVISNLSNLIRSECCRVGWTISLSLNTKLFTQIKYAGESLMSYKQLVRVTDKTIHAVNNSISSLYL